VENYQQAPGHVGQGEAFKSYGTVGCGYELCTDAWSGAAHVFSVTDWEGSTAEHTLPGHRMPKNTLTRYPVEVLVVDQGHRTQEPRNMTLITSEWEKEIAKAPNPPKVIMESWLSNASIWATGPMSKGSVTRWKEMGYTSSGMVVNSTQVGGAISQTRLLVVRTQSSQTSPNWPPRDPLEAAPRCMSNLLTPPGLVPRAAYRRTLPTYARTYHSPTLEAMPWEDGLKGTSWISTDRGYRPITKQELLHGLGRKTKEEPHTSLLRRTTSVYLWEYAGRSLLHAPAPKTSSLLVAGSKIEYQAHQHLGEVTEPLPENLPEPEPYQWTPPSIARGSKWFRRRCTNLFRAAKQYPGREVELVNQGLVILDIHRSNYDSEAQNPLTLRSCGGSFHPNTGTP